MATFQAGDFPIDPNTVDGTELAARLNRMKIVLDKAVINGENDNVGIGMTNPVTKLDVEGRARFLQNAPATTGAVVIRQDITNTVGGYVQWTTNDSSAQTGYMGVLPNQAVVFGHTNGEKVRIEGTTGNVGIGTDAPTEKLDVKTNTNSEGSIRITNISTDPGAIANFCASSSLNTAWFGIGGSGYAPYAQIRANAAAIYTNSGAGIGLSVDNVLGDITFGTGAGAVEKMRIDKDGVVGIGTTKNYGGKLNVFGKATYNADGDLAIAGAGSYKFQGTAGGTTITTWDYLNYTAMEFIRGTGDPLNKVGSITCTELATAYNTASDYRLKENVAPMTGGLATVAKLKPCTYTWKANGSAGQGFIAHELQAVVPECVSGTKDAMQTVDDLDADGNKIGTKEVPAYQGVDTSFLVATLVAAIQELKGEVDALKAAQPKVVTK